MTTLTLKGDSRSFLTHFAAYGLGSIVEAELACTARVATAAHDALSVVIDAPGVDANRVAQAIVDHASSRVDSWVTRTHVHMGRDAGTLSPRVKAPSDRDAWTTLQRARHEAIDSVVRSDPHWLDLAFIGSLGEPAYWYVDKTGKEQPDRGASGWEMITRNQGKDFVANRLAQLCREIATWDAPKVLAGLSGESVHDAVGKNAVDSRTPTGLSRPTTTDNAVAWCALWGIALFPVTPIAASSSSARNGAGRQSATAGILRGLPKATPAVRAHAYLPLFARPLRIARVKTLLASGALARVAALETLQLSAGTWEARDHQRWGDISSKLIRPADRDWLQGKGCEAVLVSDVIASDNPNAPELHVGRGTIRPLAGSLP